MSKIKILSLILTVVGFLFFNINFSRAADITLNIDPSVIVKTGSYITVTGTYSDAESPKTGKEVCIAQQFKERRQNDFSPVERSVRGCQEMVKGAGGSIIRVFTLTENKEGYYRYKLIRHTIGKDFDTFTLLKNSSQIEARNNVANVPLTNDSTTPADTTNDNTADNTTDNTAQDTNNNNGQNTNTANITSSNPNPTVGEKVIFTGTYSASDIPAGSNNAKVCWVINTQTQVSCVDAPSSIPNLEYTFSDALLYDVSLVARNKTDDSFIKVLDNLGVNVTQAADSADNSATSTSDGSGDMGSGASDGSGSGGRTVLNCFPNPLKFFRCDDDPATAMTVNDVVRNIINGIFGLLGAIAVGIIVYGGVLYMIAGASKDGTEKAKKIITSAAIGLIIALLSLAIVDLLFVLLGGR